MKARRWVATAFEGPEALKLVEYDVPAPEQGEVTVAVQAAGVNPVDFKGISAANGRDESVLPLPVGNEVAGVITAIGPDTEIASGGGTEGDEVLAFRVVGGFATDLTLPAKDVFAKPSTLTFAEAANLLLVGATASELIWVTQPAPGETILVHGSSGSVGVSLLQQLSQIGGVRVIGTASESNFDVVRRFAGEPVVYGPGLADRLLAMSPGGYATAMDCVGTDEAIETSLQLADRARFVTIVAAQRAEAEGFTHIGGGKPTSTAYRNGARADLIALAAKEKLVVPVARTFPLEEAPQALALLQTGHPDGKLALIP